MGLISRVSSRTYRTLKMLSNISKLPHLDSLATNPLDPRVLCDMMPYMTHYYGNPHSTSHAYGWQADSAIDNARQQIANLIGANSIDEIIFTSGATESNNIALKGLSRFYKKRKHVIISAIEHKCVLDCARQLTRETGVDVTILPVQPNGLIDLDKLKEAIRPKETLLVSIMGINNEIGCIQPISEIGQICKDNGVYYHCDAAQLVGKIPLDVDKSNIDLLSISGHKIYGPKGIGALYVRKKPKRVRLEPLFSGGGQERGIRSGTLPTNLIVGLGSACELAGKEMEYDHEYMKMLYDRLFTGLNKIEHVHKNGSNVEGEYYPNCLNVSFAAIEGEGLIIKLNDVALSSGSACTSASLEPSYVLNAIGISEDLAHSGIRFGLNRYTTIEEVDYIIEKTTRAVNELRELSPLWDMMQDGIDFSVIEWGSQSHKD